MRCTRGAAADRDVARQRSYNLPPLETYLKLGDTPARFARQSSLGLLELIRESTSPSDKLLNYVIAKTNREKSIGKARTRKLASIWREYGKR